ncbi:MAG: hypothetical protein DRJ42_22995 [Deltaproteobacteria bacterium]|nr:MAG: hypothetical protein DRJ42_22995 [Deltaproteobacteria bacterium]
MTRVNRTHLRSFKTAAAMPALTASELSAIQPIPRRPESEYLDPLDTIWIDALERMGLRVVFANGVYADYDGKGTLAIGTPRNLDPDDCVAQIVFHEICHWLVEGEESVKQVNWGVINTTLRDLGREYASLRVQAALAEPHGLRRFLANTTDHRAYYDALPDDPFALSDDGTAELAEIAMARASNAPWAPALQHALAATQTIVAAAAPSARPPSSYCLYEPPPERRSLGS